MYLKANEVKAKFNTNEVSKPRLAFRDDNGVLWYSTLGATGVGKGIYQNFGNFRKKVAFSDNIPEPIGNFQMTDNKITLKEGIFSRIIIYNEDTERTFIIKEGGLAEDLDVGEGYKEVYIEYCQQTRRTIFEGSEDHFDISIATEEIDFLWAQPILVVNEDGEGGVRFPPLEADIIITFNYETIYNGVKYETTATNEFIPHGTEKTFSCWKRTTGFSGETCTGRLDYNFASWGTSQVRVRQNGSIWNIDMYEPTTTRNYTVIRNS